MRYRKIRGGRKMIRVFYVRHLPPRWIHWRLNRFLSRFEIAVLGDYEPEDRRSGKSND